MGEIMKQIQFLVLWVTAVVLMVAGCKMNSFEVDVVPDLKGNGAKVYPMNVVIKQGLSGSFRIEKHTDGSVLSELSVTGMEAGKRYFGKISKSNASDFSAVTDIADLGEIDFSSGKCKSWVRLDYRNKNILFDSLVVANAMVRVLEVQLNSNNNKASEVLRGDIGSNVLTNDSSKFQFEQKDASGISGSLGIRQRENGVFLLTASIAGLTGSQSLPLSYFRGDFATGDYVKVAQITKYSVGTSSITFGFPWISGNIAAFDTTKGFLALESDTAQPGNLVLLSICNFGGNKVSGNQKEYSLYNPSDSSLTARLLFQEIGAVGSPLRVTYIPVKPDDGLTRYLSFHVGTTLDPTDSIFVRKVSNTEATVFQKVRDRNGNDLTYDKLMQWNVNARIVEDPLGFSNVSGSADLGINEVLSTDSIVRSLDSPSPVFPAYGGTLIFRPRKNGNVIIHIRLNESYAGVENYVEIKAGPLPSNFDPYPSNGSLFKVTFNGTSVGQAVKESMNFTTGTGLPAVWSDLKSAAGQGNFAEHNFPDDLVYPLCRGQF